MFSNTFNGCSRLTGSIPEKLFAGISGAPASNMFNSTFKGCSGLTGNIPSGLFGNLSGVPAIGMFKSVFYNCSGLTGSIPSGLFGNLYGAPAKDMFDSTFYSCKGLTGSIPSGLFGNLYGAPANSMFNSVFYSCSGLTGEIPSGLFGNLSGAPASSMFRYVFYKCSGLTGHIPDKLFGNISGEAVSSMYAWAFEGCSGLTGEIPLGLFGNLSGERATTMFYRTFYGCKGLYGKSARNPDGTYLYEVYPSTTNSYTGYMYTGTCLYDNASIPSTWGGTTCTYVEPEPEYPFELTVQSYGKYQFDISAAGTFYVNWGDGSAFQKIEKIDTTRQTISHTYAKNGTYTVKLGGRATKYSTGTTTAAISFMEDVDHDYYMLKGISGSLGAIFSTLSDGSQPRFYYTFSWCSGLAGEIPENLFAGIHGVPVSNMFSGTFDGSGFNSIPADLFAEIYGAPAEGMFSGTFAHSRITGIPANLFAGISGAPAEGMFYCTFCGSQITEIPAGLFAGISGTPAKSMFFSTFDNCIGLTGEIPSGLFGNLSGAPADYMFQNTFYNCGGLTGKSARNPDGTYLYDVFPSATSSQVGGMYTGTCMDDNANITSTWGDNFVCISSGSIPSDELSFTATTTSDTTSFSFDISAAGTFYVDWGDGTEGETITKTGTITKSISHTYAAAASYDIKIGGLATAYQTSGYTGAISFRSNKKLAGISGSLGAIFPTLSDGSQPRFSYIFNNCTNLKGSIPENLFAGVSGAPIESMFENAFGNCKGLTGNIPENLFAGISGAPTENLFEDTFYNCSGLTGGIPENLFAGIKGAPAKNMFFYTFSGCSGLTGDIPVNLFAGISGAPISGMFNYTFNGCTGLTGISGRLFAGIKGAPADYMFQSTFNNCTGLTGEIPLGLFGNLSGAPAFHMFQTTFNGCSGLTGKSARNPDGTYLYDVFPSATSTQVGSMYYGVTGLSDYASVPSAWK